MASSAQPDWLPQVRPEKIISGHMDKRFMKARKDHDWFMALALAMSDHGYTMQGKMFGKLYLFLRDFSPQGLTGKLAHINGKDVMDYLYGQKTDPQPSRHKLTRDANAMFSKLEDWMSNGKDWATAMQNAQATAETNDGRDYKSRHPWRVPFLISPAGMLALLVVVHPDMKFKDRIGALQIDWMMTQARDTLDVQEGFWKGINADNIQDVFLAEEYLPNSESSLVDYTMLFGTEFVRSRKNMLPYLRNFPPWARGIKLGEEPSDVESGAEEIDTGVPEDSGTPDIHDAQESVDDNGDGNTSDSSTPVMLSSRTTGGLETDTDGKDSIAEHSITNGGTMGDDTSRSSNSETANSQPRDGIKSGNTPETKELRRHFGLPPKTPVELEVWLAGRLRDTDREVLAIWSEAWALRARDAPHRDAQRIVRSLFLRSLGRLERLWSSSWALSRTMAQAYMVLDLEDMELRPPQPLNEEDSRTLQNPLYIAAAQANHELARLAEELRLSARAKDVIKGIADRLSSLFLKTCTHATFFRVRKDVLVLYRLRTQILIQDLQDENRSAAEQQPSECEEELLGKRLAEALCVTNWQLQRLAIPGSDPREILTDTQTEVHLMIRANGETPSRFLTATPNTDGTGGRSLEPEQVLRQLFGRLDSEQAPPGSEATCVVQDDPRRAASQALSNKSATESTPGRSLFGMRRGKSSSVTAPTGQGPPGRTPAASDTSRSPRPSPQPRPAASKPTAASSNSSLFARRQAQPSSAPAKRSCSPDVRGSKARKLDITPSDVLEKLECGIKAITDSLGKDIQALRTEFTKDSAQGQDVREILEKNLQIFREKVSLEMEALRGDITSCEGKCAEVKGGLVSLQEDISTLLSLLQRRLTSVENTLSGLQSTQAAFLRQSRPRPGQDGYLSQECVAPANWDQKLYESMLLRAGWFYIKLFPFIDGPVPADTDAADKTRSRFPEASEEHLLAALQHIHQQLYNQPFRVSSDEEE